MKFTASLVAMALAAIAPVASAAPEPATWAMPIGGIGPIGNSLRRRRGRAARRYLDRSFTSTR